MTLDIITVGSIKEDYLRAGIEEYKKRISAYARIQITEIKESRVANEDDPTAIARALEEEAEKILAELKNGGWKSLPDLAPCIISQGSDFKGLLVKTEKSMTDIAMDVGFSTSSYFILKFRQKNNISPLAYRKMFSNK
jgi:23S rRNA (pseudouridine1915-N3)-methyltransferase